MKTLFGVLVAVVLCVFSCSTALGAEYTEALEKLPPGKIGLAVAVHPDDALEAARALEGRAALVQVLCSGSKGIADVRDALLDKGLSRVSLHGHEGNALPYIDNLVNLLVLPESSPVSVEEARRVLAPGGTCLTAGPAGWEKWTKARPEAMDEWSHYLHNASNNAVAKDSIVDVPRGIQWVSDPHWTRHHDHISSFSALVSSGGRLFFINDQSTTASIHLPGEWALIAKDAFNGTTLWRQPIKDWVNPLWPLKSGPASIPRRLVALDDSVYVTLGLSAPVSCLDAATGATRFSFPDSEDTQEMVLHKGVLICLTSPFTPSLDAYSPENVKSPQEQAVVDKEWAWKPEAASLKAYDVETRKLLWQASTPVAPLSLAASGDSVYFYDGASLHAVQHQTGDEKWVSNELSRRPSFAPYYGVNVVAAGDVVLFSGGDRWTTALDANSGEQLWKGTHKQSGYRSGEDLFVINGQVLSSEITGASSSGVVQALDLLTGEPAAEYPPDTGMRHWPHQRCYRSKATERFILSSRTGVEFCEPDTGAWLNNHWVRGACLVGIMPCNGLLYATAHHCLCFSASQLEGFNALAPRPAASSEAAGNRLERGSAYERPLNPGSTAQAERSWPMHRHDPERSGSTPAALGAINGTTWSARIGGSLTSPVVADGTLVVAETDAGAIHALDSATGDTRWRFIAGGRVDSAPTLFEGRVLFGCADGWVYCLDLADGALAWRRLAAPNERQHVAYDRVESVWPVQGSVLVKDGLVHAVAGRSRFTDGGMHLLQIDPCTGDKVSERVLNERRDDNGEPIQENFNEQQQKWQKWVTTKEGKPVSLMTFNEVGKPDLLLVDRGGVFMRGYELAFGNEVLENPRKARLNATWGLTSPFWSHRANWLWPGAPASRMLVFNDAGDVFGYTFTVRYQTLLQEFAYYLYGKSTAPGKATQLWPNKKVPILVRAMVLADDKLVVAGPPDYGEFDTPEAYQRHDNPEFQKEMRKQADAWAGREGGLLWVIDTDGPVSLHEAKLPSPPVFDGMAATGAGIYVSTMDGSVVFLKSS